MLVHSWSDFAEGKMIPNKREFAVYKSVFLNHIFQTGAATCYTLRRLPPPALLRCVNQECFLDCRTTSNFLAYYSPTPSYKYVCGREEGGPPKSRTKRGEVTSRPLWWKNNLEVNDTLPDCAGELIVVEFSCFHGAKVGAPGYC